MKVFGNEREIQQGEDWNLDILLSQSNAEYIPFIVSSERINPMWAITVASTKFEKNERYVATWWQDLLSNLSGDEVPLPRFKQTVPEPYYKSGQDKPDGFEFVIPMNDDPFEALYYYTKESDVIDPTIGHKPYHYVYFDENNIAQHGYECRIRMQFTSSETSQWGSQNYMYQITLVDTESMFDTIKSAYVAYRDLNWPPLFKQLYESGDEMTFEKYVSDNQLDLFSFIKNRIVDWFQGDIDSDSPVGRIDSPQVILPPTKLQVNNNLRIII